MLRIIEITTKLLTKRFGLFVARILAETTKTNKMIG